MSEQQGYIIPGTPDGYEVIEFRYAFYDDIYLNGDGEAHIWKDETRVSACVYPILRKIEKPKKYRPFATAEEFKPHRDRWYRFKDSNTNLQFHTTSFDDLGHDGLSWERSHEAKVFDDGSPFGVEVTE